jgi:hypothetical protein
LDFDFLCVQLQKGLVVTVELVVGHLSKHLHYAPNIGLHCARFYGHFVAPRNLAGFDKQREPLPAS